MSIFREYSKNYNTFVFYRKVSGRKFRSSGSNRLIAVEEERYMNESVFGRDKMQEF